MKTLRQLMYLFVIALLLAACKGDDGDPGPKGDTGDTGAQGTTGEKGDTGAQGEAGTSSLSGYKKSGSFEGTFVGKRNDGTDFNETFEYEYRSTEQLEGFQSNLLYLSRYEDETGGAQIEMELMKTEQGLTNTFSDYSIYFTFYKELSTNSLFALNLRPSFLAKEGYDLEINGTANIPYNFSIDYFNGGGVYHNSTTYENEGAYQFFSNLGSNLDIYYSQQTGDLLAVTVANAAVPETDPLFILFNKLKFKYNSDFDIPTFYTADTDESLAVTIPDTPGDEFTITNYTMDQTTGVVTFDYSLKVSGYRTFLGGQNTTNHDITVTGKFNSGGKVYSSIVGRKG